MLNNLSAPIFFIGMPRSGTTVLFEVFSMQEDLGFFTQLSRRFPGFPQANLAMRLIDNRFWNFRGERPPFQGLTCLCRFSLRPIESYEIWESLCGKKFRRSFMLATRATDDEKEKVSRTVEMVVRYQGKKRFAAKFTGPPRIGYLRSLFPDAIFVHVIRDGRAVVNSLLNVSFWNEKGGLRDAYWEGGLSTEYIRELKESRFPEIALAAAQWKKVIELARDESHLLSEGSYIEIKYEDFVANPLEEVRRLCHFCGLYANQEIHTYIVKKNISSMNYKFLEKFSEAEIGEIERIAGELLKALGYE